MKRLLIATMVLLTVWFTCLPVSAQFSSGLNSNNKIGKNPVRYASTGAFSDGRGVWIEWKTEIELKNLGFYVYRVVGEERELVSSGLISGAYLQAAEEKITAGSYSFFDRFGNVDSVYVIESFNASGQKHYSNLIETQTVEDLTTIAGTSSEQLDIQASNARTSVSGSESILPADLALEVESSRLVPDPTAQRWVATQPGLKISVKSEGVYRVSRADLQSNGFDVNAPSERWQLYANGVEQAIIIGANGSYVEFYGKGINTLESETQVYFLLVGTQNGKRIGTSVRRRIGGSVTSSSYSQSFYKKERLSYSQNLLNGDEENFYGTPFNDTVQATINFNLSGVDFSSTVASLDVAVLGIVSVPHQVRVFINNVEIGTLSGSGFDPMTRRFDFPTANLREGANSVKFVGVNGANDISAFNNLSVKFARRYQVEQNRLSFHVPNYQASSVGGFTSANIRVFDTTNPDSPTLINNLIVDQSNGSFRVQLPSNRGRVLYAVEDSGFMTPASIVRNTPSTLSTSGNSGDLIIISHKDFMVQAEEWAAYRRTQGYVVKVVDIEDVFDEFNYGIVKSDSIRTFLNYAKTSWQNVPEYVLLIGDATFDPKNYLGSNNANFVPTKLVDTVYTETSSDETLADFNDDGLAEIAVGRIPARTSAVVSLLLQKTIAFEVTAQGLSRGVLFASDLPNGYDFAGLSDRLCSQLSNNNLCVRVNRALPNANSVLVGEMNTGRFIVNYSGHGNVGGWATSAFFSNSHADQLTNGANKLSLYTLLTCLNGYYIGSTDSLTDALLKNQNGGAAAAWASSGLTTPDVQEIMATRFYNQLAVGNTPRLGDLIKDAKTTINFGRDVRLSWGLLGDPLLKVR